jgi:hypothetical protein
LKRKNEQKAAPQPEFFHNVNSNDKIGKGLSCLIIVINRDNATIKCQSGADTCKVIIISILLLIQNFHLKPDLFLS